MPPNTRYLNGWLPAERSVRSYYLTMATVILVVCSVTKRHIST